MKFFNSKKNSLFFILFLFIFSCNYKPLFDENQLGRISFTNIEVNGDRRTAQILINKLNIIRDEKGSFSLSVKAEKNVNVSNKSASAKVLEYSISLNYMVEVKNTVNGEIIYSKNIQNTENYKPSSNYSDTINNEKKIIENLSSLIAKQIINELSLIVRNDT
mgnify:CR=1 FL=1|tara:strand:- start:1027 stop:1512 length:486 start_codon:yes stop_codon:yes gene_type:complete